METKHQPRVYSYARFSSPEQAKGDSERRQEEAAKKFAQSRGLILDDGLRMVDRGMSGFHGTHREKGAFGAFLEKVQCNQVPRGSFLLVENIDRLGREPVLTAMETIIALLKCGITIFTLSPPDEFDTKSVNDGGFWRLVAHISRANSESQRKSDLAQANWKQKRKLAAEERRLLTKRVPAWLRIVEGKTELIPEAVETVRLIFKLKSEGFGVFAIERKLNETAPWTPPPPKDEHKKRRGEGWRASYVRKILSNRAVIGEFQPYRRVNGKRVPDGEPIERYFPAVISPEIFHAVQEQMKGNKGKGGRTGKATNVFQNLVKCGYCDGSMVLVNKGNTEKGGNYLVCDTGKRGVKTEDGRPKCAAHWVHYEEFQDAMLRNLSKLRPETVLPNADEQAQQAKVLRTAIAGLDGEWQDAASRIKNLSVHAEETSDPKFRKRYEERVSELEARQKELELKKASKESALRDLERGQQSLEKWQANLAGLEKAIARDADSRIRLRAHLKEFILRVDVFAKGDEQNVEHALDLIYEFAPDMAKAKSFPAFFRYLRKRLLSTEGRFYRLHLRIARKSRDTAEIASEGSRYAPYRPRGSGIEIAPISSLSAAALMEPGKKGWKFRGPALDKLCKEFFDARKPGFVPKASLL